MKIVGKMQDVNNVTPEEREKFYLHQQPIYDFKSCSCQFGFNCDEDIHPDNRIVGWEDVVTQQGCLGGTHYERERTSPEK